MLIIKKDDDFIKKQLKFNFIKRIFITLFLIIFIYSSIQILKIKRENYINEKNFSELRNVIKIDNNINKRSSIENIETERNSEKSLINMYNINNDFAGWLNIPDTPIDYPVMSTPDNPNYYLRKDFNKNYSVSGTPFIGDGLNTDTKSFIIYAHHMKNKKMFGSLEDYRNIEYKNTHEFIYFNTLNGNKIYKVVGAFYTQIDQDKDFFRYYDYCGNLNADKMNEFIKLLSKYSIYKGNSDINTNDKVIMLSTCSYYAKNGRFVIVAKLIS